MHPFAARAGVDGSRLGNYSPFYEGHQLSGSMYAYGGQLGADVTLVEPSLENWTADDARMLDILSSKGTNSPEGKALIADIEAKFGTGNWYDEWVRLQDYYVAKYQAAKSDAERLTTLQATTTQQAAASDPTGQFITPGSVAYSTHDINAFASMSAQQQADFINGFADGSAAAYFMMVAGGVLKPEALTMIPPEYGGNKGVYVFNGVDYLTFEAWDAAVKASGQQLPGQVTSVTTSTGEVITDPDRLKNLSHEEVFGTPSQPQTGGFDPSTAFTPDLDVFQRECEQVGGVYSRSGCQIGDVIYTPEQVREYFWKNTVLNGAAPSTTMFPKPTSTAAPVVPSTALEVVDVTKTGTPVNVKGQPKNIDWNTALQVPAPALAPEDEIPVVQAGIGGGMIGMLALGGLALAVLMAPKRKR